MPQDRYRNPEITVTATKITDDMRFLRMSGREELGQAFSFEVEFAVENGDLDLMSVLDSSITVCCKTYDNHTRYFRGQIASFSYLGAIDLGGGDNRHRYRAALRPKLWSLTRRADCRIFQQFTAPDIIQKVFEAAGFAAGDDFKLSLQGTYQQRTYCVQYRETDFNFVHRLMEEEGIYYFFQYEESKHIMVLCDAPSAHAAVSGYEKIAYDAPDQQPKPDRINQWLPVGEVASGKCTLRDYDFTKSVALLESMSQSATFTNLEVYDYPGLYSVAADGDTRAATRRDELQAPAKLATAGGPAIGITTGFKFTLTNHPRSAENQDYVVIESEFTLESDAYQESSGKPLGPAFQCGFVALAAATQFRPRRRARKPFVQGPQTAIVVGPAGDDDIYTDKYGRVKVQFHWDRVGKKDENSSCWIRVSSIWAGNAWGAIQIPRIKQEVIVDFVEGDPDQPIITGRVYNDLNPVPYTLPDNKTQSTIKSRSSTGGTTDTFNELRFEDKKGSEEVYFHAEKDFNRVVENNDTLKVGADKKDKGDQTIEIFNNQTITIGSGQSNAADGSQTVDIYNNRTITIQQGNEKLEVSKGNREVDVDKGNDTHTVSEGNRAVTVSKGNDTHTISQGNREVKIDAGNDTLTITQGDLGVKITAGKCTIEAGTSIELKVGGSSIKIEPAKITLKSAEIDVTGDAKVAIAAPMIDVNGSGMTKVQGGIVKVN
jgi:type VI secretion system secreted protein VgrG